MKEITSNTEFIIGIDFGHGETSAAFYDLRTQEKKDLDVLQGKKVIPSAVAILEQEGKQTICIGYAAIANAPYAKDFQISFKKRPSEMSDIEKRRMEYFMKGVYDGILDRHPDYKTREHAVYIARPSQDKLWKSEEQAYLRIAEKAGLPVAGIQKESRAAYFRARTQPDSKIDTQVKHGVLIVDFGSSTIDFTYLNNKVAAPIDDGRQLGASEVESTLLEYAMNHPSDNSMPEFVRLYGCNKNSNPYNQMLYAFRKAKEEFYANKLPYFHVNPDYSLYTCSETIPINGSPGSIIIPKAMLATILGKNIKGGYIERVKEAVVAFKKEKLKDNKVACVYLTGGASRMDFVRDIFMDVFNLDDSHVPSDDEPSVIVSQGVAHLSYADIQAKATENELKKIAQKALSNYNWNDNLRSIITASVKAKIIDKAWDVMLAYRRGDIYECLTLIDGYSSKYDKYISVQGDNNGTVKVRNITALRNEFKNVFNNLVHTDFASACEESIRKSIIKSVVDQVKSALSAFEYNPTEIIDFKISGLSASITNSGAKRLSDKFTEEEYGIIYKAVESCYWTMVTWNLTKDRWDDDRSQHYAYYRANYSNIYDSYTWSSFLKENVTISGVNSAKKQTEDFVNGLINDYVSYAKLAIFFK